MKHICNCVLREFMSKHLREARKTYGMTQARFSEILKLDVRSYAALEHAENLCCTQTFILFLAFFCPDANALIKELQEIILKIYDNEQSAS